MNNDLYFIPMIADALKETDPKTALMEAFERIEILGRQPQYERGLTQFRRFMEELTKQRERSSQKSEDYESDLLQWLSVQVAGGLLEEEEARAVLDLAGTKPGEQEEFQRLLQKTETHQVPEIIIERNGETIASIPCKRLPVTVEIENVKPGLYSVKLDTGRLIWEERLSERELIWIYAFPEQALDLAADTEETVERTTREITLLSGHLIIRVFPGLESGLLQLKIGEAARPG
jgi:hypothetical protein